MTNQLTTNCKQCWSRGGGACARPQVRRAASQWHWALQGEFSIPALSFTSSMVRWERRWSTRRRATTDWRWKCTWTTWREWRSGSRTTSTTTSPTHPSPSASPSRASTDSSEWPEEQRSQGTRRTVCWAAKSKTRNISLCFPQRPKCSAQTGGSYIPTGSTASTTMVKIPWVRSRYVFLGNHRKDAMQQKKSFTSPPFPAGSNDRQFDSPENNMRHFLDRCNLPKIRSLGFDLKSISESRTKVPSSTGAPRGE